MVKRKDEKDGSPAGLVFVGCMFIGGGLGFIFGNIPAGGAIGMGVGFILMALVNVFWKKSKPKHWK